MTLGIPFQRVHDVKTLGFHQLFGLFKQSLFYFKHTQSLSFALAVSGDLEDIS